MNAGKYESLPIEKIKPYDRNPRRIPQNAVDAVAESIKQFGFLQPIVLDKNNVIVVGHTRWKAAMKLRLKTVPIVLASELTSEQVKEYRILDNKLNELATWDFDMLKSEIADIEFTGFEELDFDIDSPTSFSDIEEENEETLPEELQGVELTPEEQTKVEGDDKTKLDRVIIVYPVARKGVLVDILGLSVINKVVYSLDDIEKERAERNAGN